MPFLKIMVAAGSRFNTINYNEKKVKRRKAGLFIYCCAKASSKYVPDNV